jgi:hypothetical protein
MDVLVRNYFCRLLKIVDVDFFDQFAFEIHSTLFTGSFIYQVSGF